MRVLHVLAAPFPSAQGSQVAVRATLVGLAPRVELALLTYAHAGAGPPAPCPHHRVLGLPGYRRLRSGPDPVKPLLDLALAARLAAFDADLVHAHHVEALAAALVARGRTGIPVVYEAHTLLGEELPSYLPGPAPPWAAAGAALERALATRADAVVALSTRAARRFRELGCARVGWVPPALDPADFAGPAPADPRRVVYAGNADAYQDLPVLHAAMARLPDLELRVVPVAPWARARAELAGAGVAVLPRAVCGGFPMKLLNALALGVPVVVAAGSARGLPGEVVVADRDPGALAAGIRRALAGPRPEPGYVLTRFSAASRATALLRIYEQVARKQTFS